LAEGAVLRFSADDTVTVVAGTSEAILPTLLAQVSGNVSFWLDGHFSAGLTHKGPTDTPILAELAAIEERAHAFSDLTVFIDDVRCFDPTQPEYVDYPARSTLVAWADRMALSWTIEHDIFIATR
jgi:hypothetical protein